MSKLLLLLIVFAIVIWFFARQRKADAHSPTVAPQPRCAEKMVSCARCGVHLPESEAVVFDGHHYCSDEHRRLGPAD
ncbi:MAG: PP0621 family protein [Rhodocyclaceae bacterium]